MDQSLPSWRLSLKKTKTEVGHVSPRERVLPRYSQHTSWTLILFFQVATILSVSRPVNKGYRCRFLFTFFTVLKHTKREKIMHNLLILLNENVFDTKIPLQCHSSITLFKHPPVHLQFRSIL